MSVRSVVLIFLLLLAAMSSGYAQSTKENADFKLALNLYNDGLYDLAAEQLKQFINTFPGTSNGIEARFYLGLTQMKLKQYDDARLTFQTFALTYQDNPKAPEAWIDVGECYAATGNYKEAALAFERVKVFHPKSKFAPDALIKASTYFKLAGQPDDARRVLRIALQEYANASAAIPARTQLGQLYFEEGNLIQAQNELKRVIDSDPSPEAKAQALLVLGNIDQAMGSVSEAESHYREIVTKHKGSTAVPGAYLNLGNLQNRAGKYTEAIENYQKALNETGRSDSSTTFEANEGIGDCYASLDNFSSALTAYDKAMAFARSPKETVPTWWKIAVTAAGARNWSRSNDACNRLLKSEAGEDIKRRAAVKLALNAEQKKDYSDAVQYFMSFLDQHPSDAVADKITYRIASLTETKLNDLRKAASIYEQFITRFPRSPYADDAYIGAARCYDGLKEFDRAMQLYRDLVNRFPSSEFRNTAEERVRNIETFEAKEKDAGVEKLALLLGDVVSNKDKMGLSFRLGEIYFNDLKNYAAAATQFSNAINSGMNDDRFVDALYFRARSLEFLSWKDKNYTQQAVEAYQTFLKAYPNEPRSEDAELSVFMLNASSLQSAQAAYVSTLAANPSFSKRDLLLQRIGVLQEQADSSQSALSTYGKTLAEFPNSPVVEEVAYRRIPILLRIGLTDSAMHECKRYLDNFPNGSHTAEITSILADQLTQNGASDEAVDLYRKLLDDFSYTSYAMAARKRLPDAYMAAGKFNDAISAYSKLVKEEADNPLSQTGVDPTLLLSLGRTYRLAGNNSEAKNYLLRTLEQERSGVIAGSAYSTLGLIAKDEGNLELATSYFRRASDVSPGTTTSRDVANLLFENGAYIDAIKQFQLLAQNADSDTGKQFYEAHIVLARYRNDDFANAGKDAAAFIKKYKNVDADVASFELEKGLYYYRKEQYPNARKSFDHIMDKFDDTPSAPLAMYWTGKILEVTNNQSAALKQYEKLMKEYPSSSVLPRVYLALGNIYYNLEKWDESVRNYRIIVDNPNADPTLLPIAMSNLIETYETAGVYDAALKLTREYLAKYPNNEDSFDKKIKIGILYEELGYNDQAVLQLQSLLDQAGSDLEGEIRYYIAEANYNKGDYQQAILDFLKVPYLVTKKGKLDWTANSLYMAGQSYEKMGRYDQALTMYQQITERPGIDETFRAAAKKEIDRVKLVLKKPESGSK